MMITTFFAAFIPAWLMFKKMGLEGWESIVPVYNLYKLLCRIFDPEKGRSMLIALILSPLFVLIPVIGIFAVWLYPLILYITLMVRLGKAFHKSGKYLWGLAFFPIVFLPLIAYTNAVYKDGSLANTKEDFVTKLFSINPTDTVFCSNCGAKISAGSKACPACGESVE